MATLFSDMGLKGAIRGLVSITKQESEKGRDARPDQVIRQLTRVINTVGRIVGSPGLEVIKKAIVSVHIEILLNEAEKGKSLAQIIQLKNPKNPEYKAIAEKASRSADLLLSAMNTEFDQTIFSSELSTTEIRMFLLMDYAVQMGLCSKAEQAHLYNTIVEIREIRDAALDAVIEQTLRGGGAGAGAVLSSVTVPSITVPPVTVPPLPRGNLLRILDTFLGLLRKLGDVLNSIFRTKETVDASREAVDAAQDVAVTLLFQPPQPPEGVIADYQREILTRVTQKTAQAAAKSIGDAAEAVADIAIGGAKKITGFFVDRASDLRDQVRLTDSKKLDRTNVLSKAQNLESDINSYIDNHLNKKSMHDRFITRRLNNKNQLKLLLERKVIKIKKVKAALTAATNHREIDTQIEKHNKLAIEIKTLLERHKAQGFDSAKEAISSVERSIFAKHGTPRRAVI